MSRKRLLHVAFIGSLAAVLTVPASVALAAAPGSASDCADPAGQTSRCITVSVGISRALAVGESAVVTTTVTSRVDTDDVNLIVELPGIVHWTKAPDSLRIERYDSAARTDYGAVQRASGFLDLTAGETVRLEGTISADGLGTALISARVIGHGDPALYYDSFVTSATIGTDGGSSYLGFRKEVADTTTLKKPPPVTQATPWLPHQTASTTGLATPYSDDPPLLQASAISCATGTFNYQDRANVFHPSPNIAVEAWDEDPANSDDLLSVVLTDGNGRYHVCFENRDARGGVDLYLRFVTENGSWRVEFDGDPYRFRTNIVENIGDGRTIDFGFRFPDDPRYMRALRAFDAVNSASNWTPSDCWDAFDHDCRRVDIIWNWDFNPRNNQYLSGSDDIQLRADAPDSRSIVVHELGHAVMDDVYEDNWFDFHCPDPHTIPGAATRECAWGEGFADWYPAAVFNDPRFVFGFDANGNEIAQNLETPTWGTQDWGNGDTVEGRVAGALIDLADANNEPFWDYHTEALPGDIWDTFLRHRSTTFAEYWGQRGQDGHDVSPSALAALYQNTIDYDFREQLVSYQTRTRPTPTPDHRYRADTTQQAWSVIAIRPPVTADYDLRVYDDPQLQQLLDASVLLVGEVDFVAIDSNPGARPLGDYYAAVSAVNGNGDYQIQFADGGGALQPTESFTMGPDQVTVVRNHCVAAGTQLTLTLTTDNAGQDGQLFLMASDPTMADTWVRPRSEAAAESVIHGPGEAEMFNYTALADDCFGVVVVNRAGTGTYTLTVS